MRVEGTVVERFPSRRAMWLLAILALRNGSPIERHNLAGLLWPDSTDTAALHNLRQTLAGLRRSLSPAGNLIETASPRSIFLRATDGVWIDTVEFVQASRETSFSGLERAISLYRGPLLAGCDEPFAREEREYRERTFVESAEKLAVQYASSHEFLAARDLLRRVIAADPYRESAYRALMRLLVESGETAAALDLYRNLRLSLRRDLNAEPDPETTAIYRAIRQGSPTKIEPKPKRDDRLPAPLTALLGRDSEVREGTSLLDRCRLVTLTGVGGVGKTRLAVAVAEAASDHFLDGVRFVDLAPLQEPTQVPSTIASSLGVPEQAGRSMLDTLSEKIRGLNLLIVLDNCEHLTQGVSATLEVLLSSSPGLHVLATSRQSTGVAGEYIWRIPPLSTPGVAGGREALLQSDSVRLFLDRAGQSGVIESQLEAIGSICRRLDGIPLAIELAAARTNVLSPIEIEARLEDRFDLLARSSQTTARHQTLGAAMEWSWDLLTESERRMLMRLCAFRGGWTLEAAEAVSEGENALDLIASLVDRSLVVSTRSSDSMRYTMLETIRQFATEKLRQVPNWEAYFERHRDYFLAWAEEAKMEFSRPNETCWFKRLESDHDNLRAAHDWSHESGQHEEGLKMAVALARFWDTHGHLAEGRARLEYSIERARFVAPMPLVTDARVHAGWMATVQHDFIGARDHYEAALPHFRKMEDQRGTGKVLNCLAVATLYSGDYQRAKGLFHEALEIFEEVKATLGISAILANLGETALAMNDNTAARAYLEQSMATMEVSARQNPETTALTLCGMSLVDFRQNRFEEARINARLSLESFVVASAFVSIPEALSQIGIVASVFREWEKVGQLLGASWALASSLCAPLEDKRAGERERAEAAAIEGLGEAAYRSAYEAGLSLSMEQAIEYALDGDSAERPRINTGKISN